MRTKMFARSVASAMLTVLIGAGPAASASSFELGVKEDRLIGGPRGTLVITADGIEFRRPDAASSERWGYLDLKEIRLPSPTRIELATYEDGGFWKAGADRTIRFEVTAGHIEGELVEFLLQQSDRPVVTAVTPTLVQPPRFRVAVKHQRRGRGSEGTLALYDDGLVYATDRGGKARYWRLRDIFAVLLLDRTRLQVVAYEGGSGDTRPYTFELREELPTGAFDALWQDVNRRPVGRYSARTGS